MTKNIVLVGAMASGKTSIGRRLSHELNKDFFDTDLEIINKAGVSVECIFDIEGEEGFRKRESKILQELMNISNIVIATGGGIVVKPQNLDTLKSAFVIYLASDIDELVERCLRSNARPLVNNSKNVRQTIVDMLNNREPLYKKVANTIICTSGKKPYAIINKIKEIVQ